MRVAPELRRLRRGARIAFFLHVPFPPADLFRILPVGPRAAAGSAGLRPGGLPLRRLRVQFPRLRRAAARRARRSRARAGGARPAHRPRGCLPARHRLRAVRAARARGGRRPARGRADRARRRPARLHEGPAREDPAPSSACSSCIPEHRERIVLLQIAEPSRGAVAEYRRSKRELDELVGPGERTVRHEPLGADPLPPPPLRSGSPGAALPRRRRGAGDAAPGRHEPGRQGVRRLPGARAGRARAVGAGGRRRVHARGDPREPLPPRRRGRVAAPGVGDGRRGADGADACAPAPRAARRRARVARGLSSRAAASPPARFRPLQPADFGGLAAPLIWRGTRVALFLDYDGTLAPITHHPSQTPHVGGHARSARRLRSSATTRRSPS